MSVEQNDYFTGLEQRIADLEHPKLEYADKVLDALGYSWANNLTPETMVESLVKVQPLLEDSPTADQILVSNAMLLAAVLDIQARLERADL